MGFMGCVEEVLAANAEDQKNIMKACKK